jgi:hypothetical protein
MRFQQAASPRLKQVTRLPSPPQSHGSSCLGSHVSVHCKDSRFCNPREESTAVGHIRCIPRKSSKEPRSILGAVTWDQVREGVSIGVHSLPACCHSVRDVAYNQGKGEYQILSFHGHARRIHIDPRGLCDDYRLEFVLRLLVLVSRIAY